MLPPYFITLFQLITEAVFADGGDGDARVDCKHYSKVEVADAFEFYLKEEDITHLKRFPHDDNSKVILFSDQSNENFTFADAKDKVECAAWETIKITV